MAARKTKSAHKVDTERGARITDVALVRGYAAGRPGHEEIGKQMGGVSQSTVRRWFLGEDMELSTFLDLAETLETPAAYLLGEVRDEFLDKEIKALREERSRADARRQRRD